MHLEIVPVWLWLAMGLVPLAWLALKLFARRGKQQRQRMRRQRVREGQAEQHAWNLFFLRPRVRKLTYRPKDRPADPD